MTPSPRSTARLVALFAAGLAALHPPLLGLLVERGGIGGVPGLVIYVFGVWLALIVLTAVAHRSRP